MNTRIIQDGELLRDGDDADLESAFAEFRDSVATDEQGQGFIKVHKLPVDANGVARANSMKQTHLITLPIGQCTIDDLLERVRQDFMEPGEEITIRVSGHRVGERGVRFNKIFSIKRAKGTTQPPPGTSPDIAQLMRMMREEAQSNSDRTERFMREMLTMQAQRAAAPAAPATDPIAMMQQVGVMMGIFQTMMGNMRAPADAAASDPFAQMVKNLEAMKRMQNLLGGGKSDDDGGTLGLIKAIAPMATPVLQMMAKGAQTPRRIARQPAPAPAPHPTVTAGAPVEEPITEQEESDDMFILQVKQMLNELVQVAESGGDAAAAAELVLDAVPDEHDEALCSLVSDPERFLPKISLLAPACKDHAAWFEELRKHIAAAYLQDPDQKPQ